ncbi:hypothetical protein Mgra_00005362 [Meloidogyne graminicola]|uniref:Ras-GEF domain-containing protein n=1 Tax=Meloidogyne graminicola TaxID=189291 RepID=A0A8S9ZQA4_9BILA|nr:hypothetical protein Mgra_00005362 [Meloidogyne graminicola]
MEKIKLLKELNNNKIIINSSSLILNFNPERLANAISLFHFKLFFATSEHELLVQIIGRDKFHTNLAPFNLDLLLNRFNQLQLWVITEIIFASNLIQRLSIINSFIQLIQKLKENNDLFSMAAINFGLISLPTSRLNYIWNKLPKYIYYQYIQLQSFLCPKRGYKNYRILINNLKPPFVPFIPLILKELNFLYERKKCI